MKTRAAVLVETGRPLELADLDVPVLQPGQVLVEVAFAGVCHTNLLEARGHRGTDPFLPHCLGHEGSGRVREVGPDVGKVRPDDRVILSWIKGSGADVRGSVYRWHGRPVNAGAITTFMTLAVISENRLTPTPDAGLAFSDAALIGCAAATGVGSVVNTAQARPGQSIAIFGVGGVGLCAVMAAAAAGCRPVIAVDVQPAKVELAATLGATHTIHAGREDVAASLAAVCPGGLDLAIEASGRPAVMRQALESVRPRGGTAVVIGNARAGESLELDPRQLNQGKRLLGAWGGDSDPDRDFPRYVALAASGEVRLAALKTDGYRLETINQALDDLEAGRAVRPVVALGA